MSGVLHLLFVLVPVLINVAFLTLLERKILGLSQYRKGPNKVSLLGLMQPFADAIKLFSKEVPAPSSSNYSTYALAPAMGIAVVLATWAFIPFGAGGLSPSLSVLTFLSLLGLGLYPLLLAGWASNSKYALLGALRGIAQTISYEISLALILLGILVLTHSLTLSEAASGASQHCPVFLIAPTLALWLISCVAETNRTPFDFAEGESELVSGFNIEYGASGFALIFMAEYASILFFSLLTAMLLIPTLSSPLLCSVGGVGVASWWVWLRATYPRFRYDKLMSVAWKSLLPLSLGMLIFYLSILL